MVISAEARARIDAEIQKYPRKRGALLPALHIVQGELGHVSADDRARARRDLRDPARRGDGGGLVLQHVLRRPAAASPRPRVHEPALLAARRARAAARARGAPRASTSRATPPTAASTSATRSAWARAPTRRCCGSTTPITRISTSRRRRPWWTRSPSSASMLTVPYTTQYLTQHFADDEFTTLAGYERKGGYAAARKALTRDGPRGRDRAREGLRASRAAAAPASRPGSSGRSCRPSGDAAEVPGLQRRRVGAGLVQGPHPDRARLAPDARGHPDRGLGDRRREDLHLHPRRVRARPRRSCSAASTRPTRRATSART